MCPKGVVFTYPVAMRRAVFWSVCSFFMLVWEVLRNQMGTPDMITNRIIDL